MSINMHMVKFCKIMLFTLQTVAMILSISYRLGINYHTDKFYAGVFFYLIIGVLLVLNIYFGFKTINHLSISFFKSFLIVSVIFNILPLLIFFLGIINRTYLNPLFISSAVLLTVLIINIVCYIRMAQN